MISYPICNYLFSVYLSYWTVNSVGPGLACFAHCCLPSAWHTVGAHSYFWTDECSVQVAIRGGPWILEVRYCDKACQ